MDWKIFAPLTLLPTMIRSRFRPLQYSTLSTHLQSSTAATSTQIVLSRCLHRVLSTGPMPLIFIAIEVCNERRLRLVAVRFFVAALESVYTSQFRKKTFKSKVMILVSKNVYTSGLQSLYPFFLPSLLYFDIYIQSPGPFNHTITQPATILFFF